MSDLLSIGASGVRAYQSALTTVSDNIANAATPGYSRRSASLAEVAPSNGVLTAQRVTTGNGVIVTGVARAGDPFRIAAVRTAGADLARTETSIDALDRLSIQRGFSHFFPAELMGAHVGPTRCHITGRVLSMPLRVATALFGHMGIEADLRALDAEETADLAAGVALHKAHRDLIHTGALHRIDAAEGVNAFAVMAEDGGEALVSYTMLTEQRGYFAEPLRLAGLNPAAEYDLKAVWPPRLKAEWPLKQGGRFRGAALMQAGFHPPRLHPGTAVILHLKR